MLLDIVRTFLVVFAAHTGAFLALVTYWQLLVPIAMIEPRFCHALT
jgi:hypothetical protein